MHAAGGQVPGGCSRQACRHSACRARGDSHRGRAPGAGQQARRPRGAVTASGQKHQRRGSSSIDAFLNKQACGAQHGMCPVIKCTTDDHIVDHHKAGHSLTTRGRTHGAPRTAEAAVQPPTRIRSPLPAHAWVWCIRCSPERPAPLPARLDACGGPAWDRRAAYISSGGFSHCVMPVILLK